MKRLFALLTLGIALQAQAGKLSADMTCEKLLEYEGIASLVLQNVMRFQEYPGNYALAANQIMLELIGHFDHPAFDFVYLERLFRKHGFPIWLIANSEAHDPAYTIGYPTVLERIKGVTPPRYWLWLEVMRPENAKAMKARLGVTDQENLERLADTGLLMVRNVSDIDPKFTDIADEKTVGEMQKIKTRYPRRPEDN